MALLEVAEGPEWHKLSVFMNDTASDEFVPFNCCLSIAAISSPFSGPRRSPGMRCR